MLPAKKLLIYRVAWLVGAVIILLSVFLTYSYQDNLFEVIQGYMPKMFDVFKDLSGENITFLFSTVAFIMLVVSSALCAVYALAAREESIIWTARTGVRIWNAAVLSFLALTMLSAPVFIFQNTQLVLVTSGIGTQYAPEFQGFGEGYYLTWVGVAISLISGRLVTKRLPQQVNTEEPNVRQAPKVSFPMSQEKPSD